MVTDVSSLVWRYPSLHTAIPTSQEVTLLQANHDTWLPYDSNRNYHRLLHHFENDNATFRREGQKSRGDQLFQIAYDEGPLMG